MKTFLVFACLLSKVIKKQTKKESKDVMMFFLLNYSLKTHIFFY